MEYPIILWKNLIATGQKKNEDPTAPFFFAQDFPLPRKTTLWKDFPSAFRIQPAHIAPLPPPTFQSLTYNQPTYSPLFSHYQEILKNATRLPKVVIARQTTYQFAERIDPIALFFSLKQKHPELHPFAFILSPEIAFVGATPEMLYRRNGHEILVEAVAGSCRPGEEIELLASEKDNREFTFVREWIAQKLQIESGHYTWIKKAGPMIHLYQPFHTTSPLSDEELIALLHPTPAIAGTPQAEALEFIHQHEPFDRGWYAGTIGFTHNNFTEVYIAIRSGMAIRNTLHLFSGSGIVDGSDPHKEWTELDNKLRGFTAR